MTAAGSPHSEILGSKPARRLPEAYRSPQRLSSVLSAKASTIRPCKQRTRIRARTPQEPISIDSQTTNHHTDDHKTIGTTPEEAMPSKLQKQAFKQQTLARVHYPVLKPPRTTGRPPPPGRRPPEGTNRTRITRRGGGGPGTQKHAHTTTRPTTQPSKPAAPGRPGTSGPQGDTGRMKRGLKFSVERR